MPRPKKCRKVCMEPAFGSFIPDGKMAEDTIYMSIDEYEAIRLIDYEKMTQEECAAQMEVARTTITDIYAQARTKIADSMVNGKRLEIAGGNYAVCRGKGKCIHSESCRFRRSGIEQKNIEVRRHK